MRNAVASFLTDSESLLRMLGGTLTTAEAERAIRWVHRLHSEITGSAPPVGLYAGPSITPETARRDGVSEIPGVPAEALSVNPVGAKSLPKPAVFRA